MDEARGCQVAGNIYGYGAVFCYYGGLKYYSQLASLLRNVFGFLAILHFLSYLNDYASRSCVIFFRRAFLVRLRNGIWSHLTTRYEGSTIQFLFRSGLFCCFCYRELSVGSIDSVFVYRSNYEIKIGGGGLGTFFFRKATYLYSYVIGLYYLTSSGQTKAGCGCFFGIFVS